MADKFERFRIKRYDLFDLFLHKNQFPYIGRCYAWALREDARRVTDMNRGEREELFELIIPAWSKTISALYKQDWDNIAISGNETRHLHVHLIPRYNSLRELYGIGFIDPDSRRNYSPYPRRKIDEKTLMKIKKDIGDVLTSMQPEKGSSFFN